MDDADGPEPTYCYRHPDRETRISCTRCGRPICTECMVEAAVGFQCPQCVGEAQSKAPVYTREDVVGGTTTITPWVSYSLAAITAVVYLLQLVIGIEVSKQNFGIRPYVVAASGDYWRLITSMFLHENVLFVLFNLLVLVLLGSALERSLGHVRFLVLFMLAGLGAATATFYFAPLYALTYGTIGMTGAIFGLMAGLLIAGARLRYDVTQVGVLLLVNVLLALFAGGGINWAADLGGLITGALVATLMAYAPRANRQVFEIVGCLLIFVVLAAAIWLRGAQIRSETVPAGVGTPVVEAPVYPGLP